MTNLANKPNTLFWIIGVVALIWNGMGVNGYLQQVYMTDSFKIQYNQEQLDLISNTPSWVVSAFAIAVFFGVIGSVLLLLRKKQAQNIFIISLIAVLTQMSYYFVIESGAVDLFGPGGVTMPIMIVLFAFFLVWYSRGTTAKGWLS